MRAWYQMSEEEALQSQNVGKEGLTEAQAEERLKEHGRNVLQETKKKSAFQVFLEQFKDLLVIILIVAAVITPPDVTSQVLVAIPLMILFYASIILCKILFRRKLAEQEEDLD